VLFLAAHPRTPRPPRASLEPSGSARDACWLSCRERPCSVRRSTYAAFRATRR
jgi:hypothetical protein